MKDNLETRLDEDLDVIFVSETPSRPLFPYKIDLDGARVLGRENQNELLVISDFKIESKTINNLK